MKSTVKSAKKMPSAAVSARDARFRMVMKPYGDVAGGTKVQFGGVTVVVPPPNSQVIKKQIAAGRKAASGLTKAIMQPGVRLKVSANTPLFRADSRDPSLVVRTVNGETTRGRFVRGQFVAVA
jgi:hypothetical protein